MWSDHMQAECMRSAIMTYFNRVFKNFDILLKSATEIVVVRKLSVQNLDRAWSTRPRVVNQTACWLRVVLTT